MPPPLLLLLLLRGCAGKASGFPAATPASAASAPAAATAAAAAGQQQQRPEPGELGSKAQLEAALVAAALHLLSLLPPACDNSATSASSVQQPALADLRRLVQQAQRELLPGGLEHPEQQVPAMNGSGMGDVGGGATAGFGPGLFDLSLVTPKLAAAAAAGLTRAEAAATAAAATATTH
jgi:hypothetical protein